MAVEVEAGAYMNQVDGVFSHNPLHDLESLWWVGVWFLLCHYDPNRIPDSTVEKHVEVVKKYGETLFNNRRGINPLSRRHALTDSALLANIQPLFFLKAHQYFIVLLNLFRKQLVEHYKKYNPMPIASQDWSFFNSGHLHGEYGNTIKKAIKELKNDSTPLWLFRHVEERIEYLKKENCK